MFFKVSDFWRKVGTKIKDDGRWKVAHTEWMKINGVWTPHHSNPEWYFQTWIADAYKNTTGFAGSRQVNYGNYFSDAAAYESKSMDRIILRMNHPEGDVGAWSLEFRIMADMRNYSALGDHTSQAALSAARADLEKIGNQFQAKALKFVLEGTADNAEITRDFLPVGWSPEYTLYEAAAQQWFMSLNIIASGADWVTNLGRAVENNYNDGNNPYTITTIGI